VNLAQLSESSFHDALAVGGSGDIGALEDCATSASNNFFSDGPSGSIDVRDDNRGAFTGEQ